MSTRLLTLALVVVLPAALGATGCDRDGGDGNAEGEPTVRIVARVNGEPITKAMLAAHARRRAGQGLDSIGADQRETLTLELVEMALIAQDARDQGLHDTPDVRARLRNLHFAVLAEARLDAIRSEPVPEERLRERYQESVGNGDVREVRAHHIMVNSTDRARAIIEQLDSGEAFAELAQQHSQGPAAGRGGDLGWVVPQQMRPAIGNAIAELDPGEHTREPVTSDHGHHVLMVADRREREPPGFEAVTGHLREEIAHERMSGYIQDLRESGEVELYRPTDGD